jgi:hypothetical protein
MENLLFLLGVVSFYVETFLFRNRVNSTRCLELQAGLYGRTTKVFPLANSDVPVPPCSTSEFMVTSPMAETPNCLTYLIRG